MNPMFERVVLVAIGLLMFWQILLPLIRERPLFPLFRRKWDPDQQMKVARQRHDVAVATLEKAKLEAETLRIELEAAKLEAAVAASKNTQKSDAEQSDKEPVL